MPAATLPDQLTKYLSDAHAIETQALAQLRSAPTVAGDHELATAFLDHLHETQGQERRIQQRLSARGAAPSRLKEAAMAAGGKGFVLFARSQPDTPGKLAAHAYSYEHLELASYELLQRVAERAGDTETATAAREIGAQERAMGERLDGLWDRAVDASLREVDPASLEKQVVKYLADAHAIEAQAIVLLERGPKLAGDPELARIYAEHLEETRGHEQVVRARLEAHGAAPSKVKDAAMRLGALNWGGFFQSHPDTPGKLAAFAFAFEHLEIGAYEELRRIAERAGDVETVAMAERTLAEERAAAAKLAAAFDRAVDASLGAQSVA